MNTRKRHESAKRAYLAARETRARLARVREAEMEAIAARVGFDPDREETWAAYDEACLAWDRESGFDRATDALSRAHGELLDASIAVMEPHPLYREHAELIRQVLRTPNVVLQNKAVAACLNL